MCDAAEEKRSRRGLPEVLRRFLNLPDGLANIRQHRLELAHVPLETVVGRGRFSEQNIDDPTISVLIVRNLTAMESKPTCD